MRNDALISKYMQFNKILLSTLNINKKTIDLFDGEKNQIFSYKDYFLFVANYFDLIPDFVEKSIVVLDTIDVSNELLEIDAEYKNKNGVPVNFIYHIIKQNDEEFLLSIQEKKTIDNSQLDQMTKANPKSYIDNRAKNNILTKTPFLLMYIDIDNFKHINDEYGQLIGDMILIEMVSACKNVLGDKGAISRVGGDRFLVIYDIEDDYETVHDFLFYLKQQMQRISACTSRGIGITVTIGSAQYPKDGQYELMLLKCKKALIRGKNKGRDCFIMYLEEKCGKVTLEDKIDDKEIKKIDNTSTKNDLYSLITDVNQLLNDDRTVDESINKAISLIGTYFYIDRVSIARLDIKTHKIRKHHYWFNPKISIKHEVYCVDSAIPYWAKALGVKNYVMIDDTNSLPLDHPLKELFKKDYTRASMSFELVINGKSFGLIRFDMTTGVRHWQNEDFQVFLLISQLFVSYFQKNYLKDTNYKTFYIDSAYDCNNFTKMFTDAGEKIINSNITDYFVIELDLRNIVRYKTLIGNKKMYKIVRIIVDVLESKENVIYGKKSGGPFVIFIDSVSEEEIKELINNIQDKLNEFTKANNITDLSCQVGVYKADSRKDSLIDAISNANLTRVLNKTKDILFYSEDIRNASLFKTEMLLRIDEALENGEFLLYLQPKISTKDGRLIGAEALTRWYYKKEKLLFPDTFIPVFESQGVINKLDFSVFRNVCIYQQLLIKEGYTPVPISVNVSRYVSDFDEYIKTIENIRSSYQIDPKYIEIEITEGMYYENTSLISGFINKLHSFGYKVSMDDFGAGYSNLVSMAKLNFDIIKFDKSFCLDLDNDNVKVMLDKLIELIKMLKMSTICEGVETKENVDYLTKIGCDSIQGYYFSKPIPWDDFKKKYIDSKYNR